MTGLEQNICQGIEGNELLSLPSDFQKWLYMMGNT